MFAVRIARNLPLPLIVLAVMSTGCARDPAPSAATGIDGLGQETRGAGLDLGADSDSPGTDVVVDGTLPDVGVAGSNSDSPANEVTVLDVVGGDVGVADTGKADDDKLDYAVGSETSGADTGKADFAAQLPPDAQDAAEPGLPKAGWPPTKVTGDCVTPLPFEPTACTGVVCAPGQSCLVGGNCAVASPAPLAKATKQAGTSFVFIGTNGHWGIIYAAYPDGPVGVYLQVAGGPGEEPSAPIQVSPTEPAVMNTEPMLVEASPSVWLALWRRVDDIAMSTQYWARPVYLKNGPTLGAAWQVNSTPLATGGGISHCGRVGPYALAVGDGKVVVAWSEQWPGKPASGCLARLVSVEGSASEEVFVSDPVLNGCGGSLLRLADGTGIVAYQQRASKKDPVHVFARQLFAQGNLALGVPTVITPQINTYEALPGLASMGGDKFLLAWKANNSPNVTAPTKIYARRGAWQTGGPVMEAPLYVGMDTEGSSPHEARIAADASGRLAIGWSVASFKAGGPFLRWYFPKENLLECATITIGAPVLPPGSTMRIKLTLTALPAGGLLAAWQSGLPGNPGVIFTAIVPW